jgi:SAM-dependent methyltransferase
VTGVDIAPGLIDRARAKADIEGIEATFDVGDAEALPYEDGSFDVVSSAIGSQFAPDHAAVASELARVCAPAGRLGLACWTPTGGVAQMFGVMKPFMAPMPEGAGVVFDWGREDYVRERLGDSFDLEIEELDTPLHARSAEDIWVRFVSAYGPTKALVESLDVEQATELHHNWLDFFERDRKGDEIVHSRTYLLITGTRK